MSQVQVVHLSRSCHLDSDQQHLQAAIETGESTAHCPISIMTLHMVVPMLRTMGHAKQSPVYL